MGVITKLTFDQISKALLDNIQKEAISADEMTSGVSDTVYRVTTKDGAYILKLFESATFCEAKAEKELLEKLKALPVTRHASGIFALCGKPCALYEAAKGSHPSEISLLHIQKIGEFLASMHAITKGASPYGRDFRGMCEAKKNSSFDTPFEEYAALFDDMSALSSCGVIHGDLFGDNIFFEGAEISSVIDFIEAFSGPFCFELGVAAFAFCKEKNTLSKAKLQTLADSYGGLYGAAEITACASYAALFYGVGRYARGGDWNDCLAFLRQGR